MSDHSELRDLRSDDIHFQNKYKFMSPKITMMPQIKEAFVLSNVNTKSALQYPIEFCFDVSIIGKNIFKKLAYFICACFINFRFNVCVLAAVIIAIFFNLIFRRSFIRIMSENNCSHKNVLLIIKHIWRTN